MTKSYYVYILTNKINTTFYTGVTSNLHRRIYEHKYGLTEGFSKKYKTTKLVFYEETNDVNTAIEREKQIKNWHRDWKINQIRKYNPEFEDLAVGWFEDTEEN